MDHQGHELTELQPVETLPRPLAKLAPAEEGPADDRLGEAPVLTLRGR